MRNMYINMVRAYISGAVKGIIKSAISNLNEVVLDFRAFWQFRGIYEIGSTHFLRPGFFARISINGDDTRGLDEV